MTARRLATARLIGALSFGAILLGALSLGGCAPSDAPVSSETPAASESPSSSPSSTPKSPSPEHTESDDGVVPLELAGTVEIDVTGDRAVLGPVRNGSPSVGDSQSKDILVEGDPATGATVTVELAPGQALALTVLHASDSNSNSMDSGPLVAAPQLDGSVAFLDGDRFVLGLGAPTAAPDTAGLSWQASAPSNPGSGLTLLLTAPVAGNSAMEPAGPITARVVIGQAAALSATWGEAEGGRSLAVEPSGWGRAGGLTVMEYGWESVVALAPDADSTSMAHQFQCHALGAPKKAFWNLEPWRDDVGLLKFISARCNP